MFITLRNKSLIFALLFLFTFIIFGLNFRYIGSKDLTPNELLPLSLIYERDFDFDEFVDEGPLPYWFEEINGRVVSIYSIIPGILNLPAYLCAFFLGFDLMENRILLSLISSLIISSLSVGFMYLCLAEICKRQRTAILFALIYAFATCVWSVTSRGIWEHGPFLLFITISLFLLLNKNSKLIPYSGFFLGMAVFSRFATIVIALPLSIYVFFHHRNYFKKYIVLTAIPAIFLFLYAQVYWDSMFSLTKNYISCGFGGSILPGLAGVLISPARGLLIFSPVFIFSLIYLFYSLFSKNIAPVYKYLSISVVLYILMVSAHSTWWGGHCFGYRLLIELIPALTIFLALYWEKIIVKYWHLKIIFGVLLLISIYIHFLGANYFPGGFNWSPNDIDFHRERLWNIKDTEIARCTSLFIRDLHPRN